ncbi:hypothetical protein K6L24_05000 [Erwinia persicina]|uniref:hypothetical protein n=1 Tax=Erwinia persicina TaxID=55211 RepID=UPI001C9B74CE|nr:hypothetical protein [Erwinia persicina]QZQ51151.1 hypothetical protein K6L24_05000 [Erwinia persicina]
MTVLKNELINDKINRSNHLGASSVQLKPLYVERSIFDIDPDTPIFKIMRMRHFIADVQANCLTHMFPDQNIWVDPYENLLMKIQFTDSMTQQPIYLSGMMGNLYATCWTLNDENQNDWLVFSGGEPAIRIESTPRKLLQALMNINDKYFMLHHYIGKVRYESEAEVMKYFHDPNYNKHLDALGQATALALMLLRDAVADENEVRLVYEYNEDATNNPWVKNNVKCTPQNLCHVPIDWSAVLDSVSISMSSTPADLQSVLCTLTSANINLPVNKSSIPDR